MDLNLMMVLSMRQKEMSYQQILRSSTATPSSSFLAPPSPYGMAPQSPLMVGGGGGGGGRQAYSALPPLPRARVGMKTPPPPHGHLLAGGAISPLSVGHLPYANPTSTYDQFGFTWHWITEVCAHFALQRQTAHFAVQYAQLLLRKRAAMREQDVYAALRNYDDVFTVQRELRVLGVTTVFMAAKIEEVHPPKAVDLAKFISERGGVTCAGEDLVRHEAKFLQELNWNLHPTTPYSWLLFLLSGASVDQPLDTMGDFVNPTHNLAGTKELFVSAIRLIDTALLDYQAVDFLPSVLAGTALLLVDQSLDLMFVAQFLQLDANVLWECKTWLYALTYSVCDLDCQGTQDKDRWAKVPDEELLFIQSVVPVPTHLANGLLRSENTSYSYASSVNNQFGTGCASCNGFNTGGGVYQSGICASPCSSDNYGCFCKGGYHTCGNTTPGPHVYHFKYGWQGVDGGLAYDAGVSNQETMHYA